MSSDFYQQPDFYHFTQDSIELVQFVSDCEKLSPPQSIFDFGAGSGVVGIELALKMESIKSVHFLEAQVEFLDYLKMNVAESKKIKDYKSDIFCYNFSDVDSSFPNVDVVVSNPPYFTKGSGIPSHREQRQIARTWEIDNWNVFFKAMHMICSPGARCYFVTRSEFFPQLEIDKSQFRIGTKTQRGNLVIVQLLLDKN